LRSIVLVAALIVAVLLFGYLLCALLAPEWFQ
jgi:K+-transporting ATPase KdpF subunit